MSDRTERELMEKVEGLEKALDEARTVISKLSRQQQDYVGLAGTLNHDVAELKNSVKGLQNWAKDIGSRLPNYNNSTR